MAESREREFVPLSELSESRRAEPGLRGRLSSLGRAVLATGALALLAATFMPLFHPLWPLLSLAEHFALQLLAGALPLALLALVLRRWFWFALVIGIALIQVWIIHPYWPSPAIVVTQMNNETRLKIVSLNVWVRNDAFQATRDYLIASDADVIGLVEVTPRWKAELAPLAALYPYRVDCVGADERCEEMLLSKHPFVRSGAGRTDRRLPVLAWGEIVLPRHGPVTIAVTHLVWPLMSAKPATLATDPNQRSSIDGLPRIAQAEQAAQLVAGLDRMPGHRMSGDLILMGDFNAAPWSRIQTDLRAQTGLDNAGVLAPSWPAWGPAPMRLPIDHILARGQARVISFTTGPDVGSDHLPVEAVVSLLR